jgi:hypothetical protein
MNSRSTRIHVQVSPRIPATRRRPQAPSSGVCEGSVSLHRELVRILCHRVLEKWGRKNSDPFSTLLAASLTCNPAKEQFLPKQP